MEDKPKRQSIKQGTGHYAYTTKLTMDELKRYLLEMRLQSLEIKGKYTHTFWLFRDSLQIGYELHISGWRYIYTLSIRENMQHTKPKDRRVIKTYYASKDKMFEDIYQAYLPCCPDYDPEKVDTLF